MDLLWFKKMACKLNGCNQKLYKIKSTKSIFYTLYYAFYCWASVYQACEPLHPPVPGPYHCPPASKHNLILDVFQ